jgi:hypothetical protein
MLCCRDYVFLGMVRVGIEEVLLDLNSGWKRADERARGERGREERWIWIEVRRWFI